MFQEWIDPQRRASAGLMFLAIRLNPQEKSSYPQNPGFLDQTIPSDDEALATHGAIRPEYSAKVLHSNCRCARQQEFFLVWNWDKLFLKGIRWYPERC